MDFFVGIGYNKYILYYSVVICFMTVRKIIGKIIITAFIAAAAAIVIFISVTLIFMLARSGGKELTFLWYTEIGETTYINFKEIYVDLDDNPFVEGNRPKSSESYSLLKSFVNLEFLYTNSAVPVSDLSFLEHTRKIKVLSVLNGDYTDLSPLSNLKQLAWLAVSVENAEDLSPLCALENAEIINLFDADNFGSEDFEELARSLPNCKIEAYAKDSKVIQTEDGSYERSHILYSNN